MNALTSVVKRSFTVETHSRKFCDLDNKPSFVIQNESASKPYSKYTLISNIYVDKDTQSFETPIKTIIVSTHQGPIFCWIMIKISRLRLPE